MWLGHGRRANERLLAVPGETAVMDVSRPSRCSITIVKVAEQVTLFFKQDEHHYFSPTT